MRIRSPFVQLLACLAVLRLCCVSAGVSTRGNRFFTDPNSIPTNDFAKFVVSLLPAEYAKNFVVEVPFSPTNLDTEKRRNAPVTSSARRASTLHGRVKPKSVLTNGIGRPSDIALKQMQAKKMLHNLAVYEIADATVFQLGTISSYYARFVNGLLRSKANTAEEAKHAREYESALDELKGAQVAQHKSLLRIYRSFLSSGPNANSTTALALSNLPLALTGLYSKDKFVRFSRAQEEQLLKWATEFSPELATHFTRAHFRVGQILERVSTLRELQKESLMPLVKEARDAMVFALKTFEHLPGFNMPVLDGTETDVEFDESLQKWVDRDVDPALDSLNGANFIYDADFIRHRPAYRAIPVHVLKNAPSRVTRAVQTSIKALVNSAMRILNSSGDQGSNFKSRQAVSSNQTFSSSSEAIKKPGRNAKSDLDDKIQTELSYESLICHLPSYSPSTGAPRYEQGLKDSETPAKKYAIGQVGTRDKSKARTRIPLFLRRKPPLRSHPISPPHSDDEDSQSPPESPNALFGKRAYLNFSSIVIYELRPGSWLYKSLDLREAVSKSHPEYERSYFGALNENATGNAELRSSESKCSAPILSLVNSKGVAQPKEQSISDSMARASAPRWAPLKYRWCYAVVGYDMQFSYAARREAGSVADSRIFSPNSTLTFPISLQGEFGQNLSSEFYGLQGESRSGDNLSVQSNFGSKLSTNCDISMEAVTPLLLGRIYC